jgi:hypothetical protein
MYSSYIHSQHKELLTWTVKNGSILITLLSNDVIYLFPYLYTPDYGKAETCIVIATINWLTYHSIWIQPQIVMWQYKTLEFTYIKGYIT